MWNRSCFRMRALLVYATAPRKAGSPNFSTAEMVLTGKGCSAPLEPAANQGGKNCCFQRKMHSRTGWIWRVVHLLQEERSSTNQSTKRSSSAVSVLESQENAGWGGLQCCRERSLSAFPLEKLQTWHFQYVLALYCFSSLSHQKYPATSCCSYPKICLQLTLNIEIVLLKYRKTMAGTKV